MDSGGDILVVSSKFFCQWCWPDTDFVDLERFQRIMDDIERYSQTRRINAH